MQSVKQSQYKKDQEKRKEKKRKEKKRKEKKRKEKKRKEKKTNKTSPILRGTDNDTKGPRNGDGRDGQSVSAEISDETKVAFVRLNTSR